MKMAKSSLARGHMGGADWGYLELGIGTPPSVRGFIYKKKVPGPNTQTAATIRKEVLNPPPQKKRGTVRGATGVKIQKIIGGSFLVLK